VTKMSQQKKTGCKYLHLLEYPLQKLLYIVHMCSYSMQSIMSVYYPHKVTFMLAIL